MTLAMLIAMLPEIEALLKDAPEVVADVEAIIARVKGGAAPGPAVDPAASMAATDDKLKAFK